MPITEFPIEDVDLLDGEIPIRTTGGTITSFLEFFKRFVHIDDFIPKAEIPAIRAGTSTFDIYAALILAIAWLPAGGGQIDFGRGTYVTAPASSTIHLKKAVTFRGQGGFGNHFPEGDKGTVLLLPGGFVAHGGTTDSTGLVALSGDAAGTTWIGMSLFGAPAGSAPSANDCIWMRTRCRIVRCTIERFKKGVYIYATAVGGDASNAGNANCWHIDGLDIGLCSSHAVHVDGPDVNAGSGRAIIINNVGGCGIYDSSFLGNGWDDCHTADTGDDSFKTDDGNCRAVFKACYSEASAFPPNCVHPTVWIGGLQGAGFAATHTALTIIDGTISAFRTVSTVGGRLLYMSTFESGKAFLEFGGTGMDQIALMSWNETVKMWAQTAANSDFLVDRLICTALSTEDAGRGTPLSKGSRIYPRGFALGDGGSTYRWLQYANAMPSSGPHAQGEFVFNSAPVLDANNMIILGWSSLTTSSNHVAGVDWAICRVSHVSPAT